MQIRFSRRTFFASSLALSSVDFDTDSTKNVPVKPKVNLNG